MPGYGDGSEDKICQMHSPTPSAYPQLRCLRCDLTTKIEMVPYITGCEYIYFYPKKFITCHHVIGWNLLENGVEIEFRHKCAQLDLKSQPNLILLYVRVK